MAKTHTLPQKLFVEALGTFLLVMIGAGSIITTNYFMHGAASNLLIIAVAHGLALALAVTIAMGISGGHINPAVTIGMLVTRRIKAAEAGAYIVAQVIGAYIGAVMLAVALPAVAGAAVSWGAPSLAHGVSAYQGIAIEAMITFVLVMAVFGTAVDERAPKIGGFGIGLALMMGILVAGPFTGAAANPARAFGPELFSLNFADWYVYWIGPVLGGIIAALIYQHVILRKR